MDTRLALVTGASRGIGRGVALALAERGYELALVARSEDATREVAERATAAGAPSAVPIVADLGDPGQCAAVPAEVAERCGRDAEILGTISVEDAAMAKWWRTEMQGRVLDRCVQLFGGYVYMEEYPIARAWADGRIARIFGGTTEVMKEIVGRSLIRG